MWYEDWAIQLLKFSMSQEVKEGPFAALTFDSSKMFILTYFRKLMWFYSLATKASLLGKVWGKTFFRCADAKCPGPLLQRSPLNFYIFLKRKKKKRPGKKLLLILPFIFFSEGTVTIATIWLVLSAVRIFLSLPTGNGKAFGVAEYIPTFTAIFHKSITVFQLGNIFKQRSRSEAQADN